MKLIGTELYVDGPFAGDRAVWTDELQRHRKNKNDDEEETSEKQEAGIMKCTTAGDRHLTEEG